MSFYNGENWIFNCGATLPQRGNAKKEVRNMSQTLHKKWGFSLRISSANVTKSAGNRGFDHIYWRTPQWKTLFFVQWNLSTPTASTNTVDHFKVLL